MNSLNWEKCVLSAGLNVKLLPVHHHLICKSNWLSLPPVFYLHSAVFQRKRLLHMIGIRVPTRWWIYWGWFVYFRIVFLNIKLKEAGDLCSHWMMIFISWPDSAASQLPPLPVPQTAGAHLLLVIDRDKEQGEKRTVFTPLISLSGMNDYWLFLCVRMFEGQM